MASTTLTEYVAGIARWVGAGCDQGWSVVLLADWAVVVGR